MKYWIRRITVGMAVGAVLAAAAVGIMELIASHVYHPGLPDADYPEPRDAVEARAQDLDYFRHYLELEKSYTEATRASAMEIIASLEASLAELTDAGFQLGVARAVAVADNGHSNIWLGRFSRTHGRLPLRFYWFADGIYVVRAHPEHADLLGAELLAVGDTPLPEAAYALRQFMGGTDEAFRAYRGPIMLELPSAHYAVGQADSEGAVTMTFRLPDSSVESRKLEVQHLAGDFPLFWPHSYLMASPPEAEPEPWKALAGQVGVLPDYLQDEGETFRMKELPGGGIYIQYRANVGDGIKAFEKSVRRAVHSRLPQYLVLDQRFNGGGDYTKTAGLMFDLHELVAEDGMIYVLTGPATFSAGISSIAFAKSTAGDRLMLVGTQVGDRERIYGETNEFELPNSRLGITFSTGLHDLANGCPPFPECYYMNYFYDVAVGSLSPDLTVETRYSDYLKGVDPVLDRVLSLAH